MRRHAAKFLVLILALSWFSALRPQQAQASGYAVVVNGVAVQGAMPAMVNGNLMVAVRPLITAMGGVVSWNSTERSLTIFQNGSQLTLYENSNTAFQNGERIWSPVAPYLNDDHLVAPGWWLASRLGASVEFTGATLIVNTGGPLSATPKHPLMNQNYYFPFPKGAKYDPYFDTMGAPRYYEGNVTRHEGTDILAAKGTPLVAVTAGTVVRYGWVTLGGYRLTIQLDDQPGYRFYYAHLDRYASGIYLGAHVKAGQLLGYVGNTGEGPERTEGHFVTHLHFGIYNADGTAIDSYPFLQFWESHKAW
ncbi:MAG TPA: peptidoglycan DD-metalloendopeptidase family protein [Symbiobacteriaceae bacterium]|jgi:hypothetical protein